MAAQRKVPQLIAIAAMEHADGTEHVKKLDTARSVLYGIEADFRDSLLKIIDDPKFLEKTDDGEIMDFRLMAITQAGVKEIEALAALNTVLKIINQRYDKAFWSEYHDFIKNTLAARSQDENSPLGS